MILNVDDDDIRSMIGNLIKTVESFIYLGGEVSSAEKDLNIRIAKAWSALDKIQTIWKSSLSDNLKRQFFRAVVESILLYGAETWTLSKRLENSLDGTYTRMLRSVLNKSWRQHPTKKELYGNIPTISSLVRERRIRFAGHCYRSSSELASKLILWKPRHGHNSI